ncbi:VOC family protein [Guptibacillus sedimenti]|uniref:VOC family protein n=1 Tax=Guptibacillus sedimenti TaxID=3025680 RepID=UPI0023628EA4|nr:VOC family protein [Pseudalkalibacillus sedimenti]
MEISEVILRTNDLEKMKEFYTETLGLSLIKNNKEDFQIAVGSSQLTFTSRDVEGEPFYHFAFNIPSNKFKEAKAWVKSIVKLNYEDGNDEVDFSYLPAKSIYFYDPVGNIVEFISRHSISRAEVGPFSQHSIQNISEISLTVEEPIKIGKKLIDIGIKERDNCELSDSSLNFMGDKSNGIFLLLNKPGRRWIFSDRISSVHPIYIKLSNNVEIEVSDTKEVVISSKF